MPAAHQDQDAFGMVNPTIPKCLPRSEQSRPIVPIHSPCRSEHEYLHLDITIGEGFNADRKITPCHDCTVVVKMLPRSDHSRIPR